MLLGCCYTHKEVSPNSSELAKSQWDLGELTQIGVKTQQSYEDAFTLEKVESIYIYVMNCNYIMINLCCTPTVCIIKSGSMYLIYSSDWPGNYEFQKHTWRSTHVIITT